MIREIETDEKEPKPAHKPFFRRTLYKKRMGSVGGVLRGGDGGKGKAKIEGKIGSSRLAIYDLFRTNIS